MSLENSVRRLKLHYTMASESITNKDLALARQLMISMLLTAPPEVKEKVRSLSKIFNLGVASYGLDCYNKSTLKKESRN